MQEEIQPAWKKIYRAARFARYATLCLLIAMFVGTHLPQGMESTVSHSDKLIHFSAYMVLTIMALASWELATGILHPQHFFVVWLCGTLYGAFDEVTQIPVGRSCDGMDWLADVVGIVTGLIIYRVTRPLLYYVLLRPPNGGQAN